MRETRGLRLSRASREPSHIVQDVTGDEIIPDDDEKYRGQRSPRRRIVVGLLPEPPIGRQRGEPDGSKILLNLEQTDGVGQLQVLQRRPDEHAVSRIEKRTEKEGNHIESDDRTDIDLRTDAAGICDEVGLSPSPGPET